ncbi:MAG: chlorophyll synthesis pathway protein BchC [Pseudomonadota bacterium]
MQTLAVVLEEPEKLGLSEVDLAPACDDDVVVDVTWSGVSTGTERLLFTGKMPPFPGMGYPLVPGYEAVGVVRQAGSNSGRSAGDHVFVPGARCYGKVHGLFGGAAAKIVVPGARTTVIRDDLGVNGILLALAATAYHALAMRDAVLPDLIVGHGVLGRLMARLTTALGGGVPTVWEIAPERMATNYGYRVIHPDQDQRRDYRSIYDVSGDSGIIDRAVSVLARNGEIVLAGFYSNPLSFAFPPAFMKEARFRIAAEWKPQDLEDVIHLIASGRLPLDGLITHTCDALDAVSAYDTAFNDAGCLKMILDWRRCS